MDFESIEALTNEQTDDYYEDLISCTFCNNCSDGTYRCHYFFGRSDSSCRNEMTIRPRSNPSCWTQYYCDPGYSGGTACVCGIGVFGCEYPAGYNLCGTAPFSRFCV